ncbi:MAG: glycosyltransferase [Hyphomicrobiaceae bacterium]|nr:glycosyltransferase [Hyphomicrobiaceae bacterium]
MARDSQIRTLILTLQYEHRASYYDDWAHAYQSCDLFDCQIFNLMKEGPDELAALMGEFDLFILLHSATGDTLGYLQPLANILADRRRGVVLSFIGNEFNSPYLPLMAKVDLLKACRVDIIATQLLEEAGSYIYQGSNAKIVSIPHALNPDLFRSGKAYEQRSIDIGMRSYRYPPYLGDNDRNAIIDYFVEQGEELGLTCDISTTKRFTPEKWAGFLGNCRAVLSTETGSWYLQPDDDLVSQVHDYAQKQRSGIVIGEDSPLRSLVRHLPAAVKSPLMTLLKKGPIKYGVFEDEKLDFDEVYERFFKTAPRCPAYSKAISSRNFDAIGTRTCQIMFPGRFNDILIADKHYIPLEPDFSNIVEVVEKLHDKNLWQAIVEEAHGMVMESHTYEQRARQTAKVVEAVVSSRL